jgi:CRP-like cAMP-binding protein
MELPMASTPADFKTKNEVLSALPDDEYQRFSRHLEFVELPHGKVVYEIGDPIEYIYFPFTAMISLVTQMADGKIIEVGLVGNDGLTGLSSLLGENVSHERAIVQIPDGGGRANLTAVCEEFQKGQSFQRAVLRYANSLMRQVAQTAACNASHTAEERLSRWLLMCHDRVESSQLDLTQEFLSEMLGTRRGTVNTAAITLQSAKLIDYHRGRIKIVDRAGLEAFSCECYGMLNDGGKASTAR